MINEYEIIETMQMFNDQHLDIRTITMGISLMDDEPCVRTSSVSMSASSPRPNPVYFFVVAIFYYFFRP